MEREEREGRHDKRRGDENRKENRDNDRRMKDGTSFYMADRVMFYSKSCS